MSRIGKQTINLPNGVSVSTDKDIVSVKGPKGNLEHSLPNGINVAIDNGIVSLSRENDLAVNRARHGLSRALLANMIAGVSQGFEKKLEINGVGYRVQAQGSDLKFNIGYSHDVVYKVPADVQVAIEQNIITISGIDKQRVGQIAAEIRALKKPEPYKGKGIKYVGERIIRKSGKSAKE